MSRSWELFATLWKIVQTDVPPLLAQLERIEQELP